MTFAPTLVTRYPALDVMRPYNGPCGICGGPDQRHRLADSIVENVGGGDSPGFVAEVYEVPVATVWALVTIREENRARHRYRWGRLIATPVPNPEVPTIFEGTVG